MRRWLNTIRGIISPDADRKDVKPALEETFVAVGYPKVGNTWLRMTLGRYLYEHYQLAEMPLMDSPEFRILVNAGCRAVGHFTHAPLEWENQTSSDLNIDNVVAPFRKMRVILLVRHPLDIIVSLYMQKRFRDAERPYCETIVDFINNPVFGLDKLLQFYRIWMLGKDNVRGFTLWRYEDAIDQPFAEFLKLLEFLGEDVDKTSASRAVEFASFDNMKALELSGNQPRYKSSGYKIFATGDPSNPNALHVRKGKPGGYCEEIPPDILPEIERRVASGMPEFYGYC